MRRWLVLPLVVVVVAVLVVGALASAHSGGTRASRLPTIAPVVKRTPGEMVPRTVRSVVIDWTLSHGQGHLLVTSPDHVRRLSALINELPQEGKATCAEGSLVGPPSITFGFRDAGGHLLASAKELDSTVHLNAYCTPVVFSRVSRPAIGLKDAGVYLLRSRRLLGRPLH